MTDDTLSALPWAGRVFLPRRIMIRKVTKEQLGMRATELAPWLLGKVLCRKNGEELTRLRITETECYFGEADSACHAHKGRTRRTETLYREGGTAYVYLCYGIHYLFNIVSGQAEFPEAVLLRGAGDVKGPGRLTRRLDIGLDFNGKNIGTSEEFWIEDDGFRASYTSGPRVGIGYAQPEDRERPWRFLLTNLPEEEH